MSDWHKGDVEWRTGSGIEPALFIDGVPYEMPEEVIDEILRDHKRVEIHESEMSWFNEAKKLAERAVTAEKELAALKERYWHAVEGGAKSIREANERAEGFRQELLQSYALLAASEKETD